MDDLHQATCRDLTLVVGQKYNATVADDMQERIQGLRQSVAKVSQRLEVPKTWIGSSGVNVLQVLCNLLDLVEQMNSQLPTSTRATFAARPSSWQTVELTITLPRIAG